LNLAAPGQPFDPLASAYDLEFTDTPIGRFMRRAVWRRMDARFQPGQRVLELNCGTGEDAAHLALNGVRVFATDEAGEMVGLAAAKTARLGLSDLVTVRKLSLEDLSLLEGEMFDGALSNFGGLNCVADLAVVARSLAAVLRPGATAMLCVMGPLTPWEWLWFLSHGQPAKAFRRLNRGGCHWRGMTIRYPSVGELGRAFAPHFTVLETSAIGALIPPPYSRAWAEKHPRMLAALDRWERRWETSPLLYRLADHYLVELRRV
jgi:SAM-dependent methyltransferase